MFIPLPKSIGEMQQLDGYFTQARAIRSQSSTEVERRLGYRAGRLREGWWLMFLVEMPNVQQFEYRGYSHLPDGIVQGHLPQNKNNPNSEKRLQSAGMNLVGDKNNAQGMKQQTIADTFSLTGDLRLAKVRPVAREHGDLKIPDYPPGSGVPQWTLTAPLLWRAAAFVGPNEVYSGLYT